MSQTTPTTRLVAGCAAALVGGGALVVVSAPVATAATGDTTYSCTFPILGEVAVPVTTTVPDLPDTPAGAMIPAGSVDPVFVFDATNIASVLGMVTDPSATGMAFRLGESTTVPLDGFSFGTLTGSSLPASASSRAFTAPTTPGVYDVAMPESFTFTGLLPGVPSPTPVAAPCATDAPAVLGTVTVLPTGPGLSESTTEAELVKRRILKGRKAKVTATVTLSPVPAPGMGEVVVKKRKKTIGTGTLESGSVTIRTTAFKKPGRYTLKVKYLGEPPLVTGSKDTVMLRVKRRR